MPRLIHREGRREGAEKAQRRRETRKSRECVILNRVKNLIPVRAFALLKTTRSRLFKYSVLFRVFRVVPWLIDVHFGFGQHDSQLCSRQWRRFKAAAFIALSVKRQRARATSERDFAAVTPRDFEYSWQAAAVSA